MLLDGKIAIITGAGAGVGRATALRFAQEGARVVCADVARERVVETAGLVEAAGGVALPHECDVSIEAQVEAVVASAVDHFGRLDIMYNNAGIPTPRMGAILEEHSVEDFQRLVGVNLLGVFLGSKHAVIQFKKQQSGGVVLNTGSVAGIVAWGGSVYGATKGGVHQLTRAVAIEGAAFGIRCNAVCPAGMPLTQFMAAGGLPVAADNLEQVAAQVGQSHPLGRPITAEDIAETAAFLCSDRASNITGVLLPVDGGYVAR